MECHSGSFRVLRSWPGGGIAATAFPDSSLLAEQAFSLVDFLTVSPGIFPSLPDARQAVLLLESSLR